MDYQRLKDIKAKIREVASSSFINKMNVYILHLLVLAFIAAFILALLGCKTSKLDYFLIECATDNGSVAEERRLFAYVNHLNKVGEITDYLINLGNYHPE